MEETVTVHPFFFGASDRPLFGMYNAPQGSIDRNHGVLICNAFGHEAIRSHRLMRQLAEGLSARGEHVLRFDYYGTGDSGGHADDGSFDDWIGDTRTALQELVDMAAVPRVSIVGLRMGAVIGVWAASGRRDVDKLLLWDPVVNGRVYLEELKTLHENRLGKQVGVGNNDVPGELVGFPFGERIGLPVSKSHLANLTAWPVRDVGLVVSEKLAAYDRLESCLSETVASSPSTHVTSTMHWNDASYIGELLQAPEALEAVQSMLLRENGN